MIILNKKSVERFYPLFYFLKILILLIKIKSLGVLKSKIIFFLKINLSLIIILTIFSCSKIIKVKKQDNLIFKYQWINPLFFNSEFEKELNFPFWFNDSIIMDNKIFQITRRIFANNDKDNNGLILLPREKYIYTFNKDGSIKKIDYYSFYDAKEISAFTFIYAKQNRNKIHRQIQVLPLKAEYKKYKDLFKIQLFTDATHHFTFYNLSKKNRKYFAYQDIEHKNNLFILKNKKYFGSLSIDSILHPKYDDWIILGSIKRPIKRFQTQNIVNQKNIFSFNYNKNGLLINRNLEKYPFLSKRYFIYDKNSVWKMSIDSVFYEKLYISTEFTVIQYDNMQKPSKIIHNKSGTNKEKNSFEESFSYKFYNN